MPWKHFSDDEVVNLNPDLVEKLDHARGFAHCPFFITSGYRSKGQNDAAGGAENSSHMRGLAVDIRCDDAFKRFRMVSALILAGFNRIGVYNAHIHVDIDRSLPQNVMWTGESH